jgi:MerR family transcriptional regulator, mercuric resistance operon regulatory protein
VARSAGIQIGELARRTGCNIETIRYYERITLLSPQSRSAGGYRLYDTADVRRLSFIRRARELGFTLDEVRAATVHQIEDWLAAAGFTDIRITLKPESRALVETWAPGQGIENYVASATIEGRKPEGV